LSASQRTDARNARWHVRSARQDDVASVAVGVGELLCELGGAQVSASELEPAVAALIAEPAAGVVLLADAPGGTIGLLAASWQMAIHVPGSYAIIQDLWVDPDWRGRSVGAALIAQLLQCAAAQGIERVEVGLPRERFTGFAATEAFYLGNGFQPLGPRMRRLLT